MKKPLLIGGLLIAFVLYTRYRQAVADSTAASLQAGYRSGFI